MRTVLTLLLLMITAAQVYAKTITVMKDGSGDFTTIRPAIEASAPGDTVLLGPGRYDEAAPFSLPGWTETTFVPITVDSLTLKGIGRETVIIGPTEPDFVGFGPKGIVTTSGITRLVVEGLTVENVRDGMYLIGRADVQDCIVRDCDLGINVWEVGSLVRGCTIQGNIGNGIATWTGCRDLTIEYCQFIDNNLGVGVNRTQNVNISSSTFENSTWSTGDIQYSENSTGSVTDCTFNGSQEGIAVRSESDVVVERNRFVGQSISLHVFDGSIVRGSRNVLQGSFAAIAFGTTSTAFLGDNHILKTGVWAVHCTGFNLHHVDIDLRNNYWGTDSADSIAAWIYDENDAPDPPFDPGMVTVLYEPFSTVPVEAEEQSTGGLKSLFRRR